MKTLLFLLDSVDISKELIRYAALLAKDLKAKLQVLHVQYTYVPGTREYIGSGIAAGPGQLLDIAETVKKTINGHISEIKKKDPDIAPIEFQSKIGIALTILEDKVEKGEVDMVMLHGQTGHSFWSQNPATMKIVRNLLCPVLIVSPDTKYQPFKHITYATDYKEEDIATLKRLVDLSSPFKSKIMALHIADDEEFQKKLTGKGFSEMLKQKTGSKKITFKVVLNKDNKDAAEVLTEEAKKAKSDLIVVLKENQNFFERIFTSSFTADLIKDAQLPVLVFHT